MPKVAAPLPPELEQDPPIVTGKAEPPVLAPGSRPAKPVTRHESPPFPRDAVAARRPSEAAPPVAAASQGPTPLADAPVRGSDPRIAYLPNANRKVIDALKQVKRKDGAGGSAGSRDEEKQPLADVLARDSLQVALRMEQNGRMDEAIRFLEKSISQSPDAASLYNRLGIILMRERGDYRRAEQMIRKATELVPENQVYATNLQQVLSRHAMKTHR
jgi:tetratricopeptide (TPR) repeat protein